jgi:hypothetical protein
MSEVIKGLFKYYTSIRDKLFKEYNKNQKVQTTAVRLDSPNEIEVELAWIQGLKEQTDFLNANMKYHFILFRIQRRELVGGSSKRRGVTQ